MYIGAMVSQVVLYLIYVIVVRRMIIKEIAILAIIDGIILFLPFLLTLVSERTSVISYYDKGAKFGLHLFNISKSLTIINTICVILVWLPVQWLVNKEYLILSIIIIITAASTGLFNIQFQKYIVLKNYKDLVKMQTYRGVAILVIAFLMMYSGFSNINVLLISIVGGNLISLKKHQYFRRSINKNLLGYIIKMSVVPIIMVLLGYILVNAGRVSLALNNNDYSLALLLIYIKSSLIILLAITPFSNYLKPLILEEYKKNRYSIPVYWKQLFSFGFLSSLGGIFALSILWIIWGNEHGEPNYFIFSICIGGAFSMWLLTSIVDLYYDHPKYLYKKIIIFLIPVSVYILLLIVLSSEIDYTTIIYLLSFTQFLIFSLALFMAFSFNKVYKVYFMYIMSIISIIAIGYLNNIFFSKHSYSLLFYVGNGIVVIACAITSIYVMLKNIDLSKDLS
jgi:hypothetical protein